MKKNILLILAFCFLSVAALKAQLVVSTNTMEVEKTDEFDVVVNVENWDDVVSAQFSMNYDPEVLEFMFVHELNLPHLMESNFGTPTGAQPTPEGIVTFSWYDITVNGISIEDGNSIFVFRMRAIEQGNADLTFGSSPTSVEIMNVDNVELDVDFETGDITVSPNTGIATVHTKDFALHRNHPNPFKEFTTIRFDLHRTSQTTLSIYNTAGTLLHQETSVRNSGEHVITLPADIFSAAGTYIYRLTTDDATATRKMTLIE